MTARVNTNLPEERTSFVGRTRELSALRELIAHRKLVSIVGPPGVGKTRLARRFARAQLVRFARAGGVWFVDASAARSADELAAVVATTLGIDARHGSVARDQLTARLEGRGRMLLVLDGVDRAGARAGAAVGAWLGCARELRVLITAREPLRIEGEQRMDLGPLEHAAERSEAAELFVERARSVRAGYAPARAAWPKIAEIVRRLDGIPLAIELAATLAASMSEEQLLRWLPRALGKRSLTGAIARSWERLTPGERRALGAVSVFSGGFALDAASRVLSRSAAVSLEVLVSLREKSLLFSDDRAAEVRFGLYEAIAAFARGKLRASGRAREVERRHASYYVAFGARAVRAAVDDSAGALAALAREQRNLTAVVERGLSVRADRSAYLNALSALVALEPLVASRGPLEPHLVLLDRAVARARARDRAVPTGLAAAIHLARGKLRVTSGVGDGAGDLERARRLARRTEDRILQGRCVMELGVACARRGCLDEAGACFARARGDFRRAGARALEAAALGQLGLVLQRQGRFDDALARYDDQAALLPSDPALRSAYHARVGALHHERGALRDALGEYRRALALATSARARREESIARAALGLARWEMGDHDRARAEHARAIAASRAYGDRAYEGICLASLGGLEATCGRLARARRLLARAHVLVAPEGNAMIARALDLYRAMLLFAESARAGTPARAAALRARVRETITRASEDAAATGEDVRVAMRILRAQLAPRWAVHEGGEWFHAPGEKRRVSLKKRPTLARILAALCERRLAAPGEAMSTFEIVEMTWPGESVLALAGANRVYVAITALRKLGLAPIVVRSKAGYLIDPNVEVARVP